MSPSDPPATVTPVPRGKPHREGVELTDLSVSRIKVADKCGLAFKYEYVDGVPAPTERAATLFGHVIHDAVQVWYGDGPDDHKQQRLTDLVVAQWQRLLPSEVWAWLRKALECADEADAVVEAIRVRRPEIKHPRQTKDFLTSDAHKVYEAARASLLEVADRQEDLQWPRDEDPLKAFFRAREIAMQLERKWKDLPRPLLVEYPFRLEFDGFSLRGRIDQLRLDPDEDGVAEAEILDIKTGRNLMTQMEAFIQAFIYDEAVRQDPDLPTPDHVVFDMVRSGKEQRATIDPERHGRIARRILNGVARRIVMGQFEPHYGFWCARCDFASLCESEIGMWTGDGTL